MPESVSSVSRQFDETTPRRRTPRRLILLLVAGAVAVCIALAVRYSPWAHEYQLRKASLSTLRSWAAETPRDPLLLYYLGTKAYNANSIAEAGLSFENAASLDPKMSRAFVGLALVQRDIGQYPQAYASAKQAQLLEPKDLDIQFLIGTLLMRSSKEKAIPEFQNITRRAPRRADAWYWLGICQQQINQKGEAIAALRKAVSLQPDNWLYQRDLGHVLLEMNFFGEARSILERAVVLNPKDPRAHYILADARLKMAQTDQDVQAVDALLATGQSLLNQDGEVDVDLSARIIGKRGEIAQRLKRPRVALTYFQQARKLAPDDLSYLYQQAEAYRLLGEGARAKELMGQYDRLSAAANEQFQLMERIKQDPKEPALRLKLARMFARNHDMARALNQYEYCLYLDPLQADAKRELDALKKKQQLQMRNRLSAPAPGVGKGATLGGAN